MQNAQNHVAGEICLGKFTPVKNDFSIFSDDDDEFATTTDHLGGQFENPNHWDQPKREKVKKFRFVVCILTLMALALSIMSRGLFYISIVEMTRDVSVPVEPVEDTEVVNINETANSQQQTPQQVVVQITNQFDQELDTAHQTNVVTTHHVNQDHEDGLHFSWSVSATNFLLSSFFMGYAPSMFFSGGIAEQYGSVSLLSVCVIGSALINGLTPFLAAFSYHSLAASRIVLGILQGPLVPAAYDIFNKWLTMTEMSVFVPLVKVAMAIGTVAGTLLPGVVVMLGHNWTYNFYTGSLICLVWLLLWLPLATSSPQTNKWIEENELQRIMRKKSTALAVIKTDTEKQEKTTQAPEKVSIPWIAIITSPSVLVLTFVKFTYNLGLDFILIESAIYLSQIHDATTDMVALIISSGSTMHLVLITFVGSLATYVIRNKSLGLSRTNWRKIFQGSSNFGMALIYLLVSFVGRDQFIIVAGLLLLVYFFYMFGAGGESMVPYDLSPKYPATIMGFAHSFSTLSGFALPSMCGLILGEDKRDPGPWRVLFRLISAAMALGGLAFVLIIKAKPILPGERAKYDEAKLQQKQQQQQQQQQQA